MTPPAEYHRFIRSAATAEIRSILDGTHGFLGPQQWRPVAYVAHAPSVGVTLLPGVLRDCFQRAVEYLTSTFDDPIDTEWVAKLPASSEGRLLAGAAHALRWEEQPATRRIVDAVIARVAARQAPDGYCLPYPVSFMAPQEEKWVDERRNYDRVCLTRGLVAAGLAGNGEALRILRGFYDWLHASPYEAGLITGVFDSGSAHNCNNGHEGSLVTYFSPVGAAADLLAAEKGFIQEFFLQEARRAEPLSLAYYPLHTPHSYVLLAFQAWLDHYRATGAAKYLEAARGAWTIVHDFYEHVGGTIAICEEGPGDYLPGSYHLRKHTGETCGSVFWADFNHRLHQLFPEDERFAAEIETVVFNVVLAAQDARGWIRYHNHLVDRKDRPRRDNTCCEVMGVPFITRLPQYLFSLSPGTLWVNLFAPAHIAWENAGGSAGVTMETRFPVDGSISLRVEEAGPLSLRIRVPRWAQGGVTFRVNGAARAEGAPGTYATLARDWSPGDVVSFDLPMMFRLTPYHGVDPEHAHTAALQYGPLLMALVGGSTLHVPGSELVDRLVPVAGAPLHFAVDGQKGRTYLPYWQVQDEAFTCYPTVGP